jgi:pyrroline-5-carboxylate reductase
MKTNNITFIGAGNMSRALVAGLVAMGYAKEKITVSNPSQQKLDFFQQQFGVQVTSDNATAIAQADIVVFAVKPGVVPTVCQELKADLMARRPLIISMASGVTTDSFATWLDGSLALVRAMPNTPAAVGAGATGLFANAQTSEAACSQAEALFRSVGVTVWVNQEIEIDMVTAISGSGPAYYFLVIEAMQEAAVKMGLSQEAARLLSLQTVLGAAKMAMETQVDVRELRRSVTSPNGTTEAAIAVLEQGHLKSLFEDAMQAAFQRAQQLAGDA